MIADYFILRGRRLELGDLYRRGGAYEYANGFHRPAFVALAAGVAVNVPGFLVEAIPSWKQSLDAGTLSPALTRFHDVYVYAWFVGFLLSGSLYLLLARLSARKSAESAAARSGSRFSR
jgi:NCS1 family nucleobase:cation symporter-1